MRSDTLIDVRPEVAAAIRRGDPVVALESTLIAHGLPWPWNLETAQHAEAAVRDAGGVPATVAVIDGRPTVGLDSSELRRLAQEGDAIKASRRDLAFAITRKLTAATTVAGTMALAHLAGIRIFATGGIGGAHGGAHTWDVSADLFELARTPVAVICAGAKSILDIPRTLEMLETESVPVIGYRTHQFPAFFVPSSGEPTMFRVDTPAEAADLLRAHWALGGNGVVLAQPVEEQVAIEPTVFQTALSTAEREAAGEGVRGKELTPFLLNRIADITEGQTLKANHALVIANARLAAQIAGAYAAGAGVGRMKG
jgi:pseudouridine-5'-phosphate glycosidase